MLRIRKKKTGARGIESPVLALLLRVGELQDRPKLQRSNQLSFKPLLIAIEQRVFPDMLIRDAIDG